MRTERALIGLGLGAVLSVGVLTAAKAAAPLTNVARVGDFSVMQIATTEPDRLMSDWLKPSAGVNVGTASAVHRNQPVVTFIVFSGCQADASGACNVTADFDTFTPSGEVYDQTRGAKVWVGHRAPPARAVQLSEGGLGLRIENKDALGIYTIRATVTDHVSGATLKTSQTILAQE
jgi:hypothetical protein